MKSAWTASAIQSNSDVSDFESYLEIEGNAAEESPNEDAPLTPLSEDTPPEEEENLDPEDPDEEDEEELDAAAVASDADGEEGDDDSPEISTISSLAEFFEVEESDVLDNLEVESPTGEVVSVGDALNSWRESEKVFEERATTLESEHQALRLQTQETSNRHLQQIATLTEGLISRLRQDFSSERMAAVRMENPDGYADMIDAKNGAEALINSSIAAMDEESQRRDTEGSESLQVTMAKQNQLLLQARPDWKNPDVLKKALGAGSRYLLQTGWDQNDIDGIMDHRILLIVDDAVQGARLRKGSDGKNIDKLRKRGLKKPTKGLRARSRRDPDNPKNRARNDAYARLKSTGDAKDAVDLFLDVM